MQADLNLMSNLYIYSVYICIFYLNTTFKLHKQSNTSLSNLSITLVWSNSHHSTYNICKTVRNSDQLCFLTWIEKQYVTTLRHFGIWFCPCRWIGLVGTWDTWRSSIHPEQSLFAADRLKLNEINKQRRHNVCMYRIIFKSSVTL